MFMNADSQNDNNRGVLSRVERQQFVNRVDELRRIVSHPQQAGASGLLLLLAPAAGVSELLRQAYDELFNQNGKVIPIYFTLPRGEKTAVSTAIEFLNTFLLQYIAFRRGEPALCQSSLTLNDLLGLAAPADYEWIEELVETYNRERFGNDDAELIRWCLSAPQRAPARQGRAFVMLDAVPLVERRDNGPALGTEMIRVFSNSKLPYVIAGLRRQMLDAVHSVKCNFDGIEILRLEQLSVDAGRSLVEQVGQRQQVALTEETRDLLVQQFECSPYFISSFLQAARELKVSLTTYLDCEQLYVDELMGGRLDRYFSALLEDIVPDLAIRRAVIRTLFESRLTGNRKASFESWKRNLRLESRQLEEILRALHIQEFITWDGSLIDAGGGSTPWNDYLEIRYRLELAGESRALVVAEAIAEALKRAPHTMARYYRRVTAVGVREVLASFDCQRVPAIFFD